MWICCQAYAEVLVGGYLEHFTCLCFRILIHPLDSHLNSRLDSRCILPSHHYLLIPLPAQTCPQCSPLFLLRPFACESIVLLMNLPTVLLSTFPHFFLYGLLLLHSPGMWWRISIPPLTLLMSYLTHNIQHNEPFLEI